MLRFEGADLYAASQSTWRVLIAVDEHDVPDDVVVRSYRAD